MNIIIPAAGNGQRFKDAGYKEPKPLIPVCGTPMLRRVMGNVMPDIGWRVISITQRKDEVGDLLGGGYSHVQVELDSPTGGAVDTILKAREYIDDSPLLIANCDQITAFDVGRFITWPGDGVIATFQSSKPHHSYVEVDYEGFVTKIAEKEVISHKAVTGVYYFRNGTDFLEAADKVIADDKKVKGEFYVSTVIDQLVKDGKRLSTYEAPVAILGTPEELQLFEMAVQVAKTL